MTKYTAQQGASPRGRLVVLAGPSAVGKSTVVRRLVADVPDLYFSVSMTTRDPRPGESDGVDYFFVSREGFDAAIARGDMLEWAEIHGGLQRSGTPLKPVEAALEEGRPVLVEVDIAGAEQIKAAMPEVETVFLAPPSVEVLRERLVGRGTETSEVQERRLETALNEMAHREWFDTIVINDDVDRAVDELVSLLVGKHA